MAHTYPGDRTATQAPSAPPVNGSPPTASLPDDGDADSAASVAQAFKVAMDYIAFGQNPFARASQYDQDIWAGAEDAALNGRWGIDHWGFPRHSQIDWTEDWTPDTQFIGSGPLTSPKWEADCLGTASAIGCWAPGTAVFGTTIPDQFRALAITIDGSGGGNRSAIGRRPGASSAVFADDTLAIMDVWAKPIGVLSTNWIIGLSPAGENVANLQNAVFFRPTPGLPGGSKWQYCTMNGGTATAADTGVSYNTTGHWFRIVWVGKNLDDGAVAARALFYIDGVRVANITTNLPNNTGKLILPTFGGYMAATVANPVLLVGPPRYRQITSPSTSVV